MLVQSPSSEAAVKTLRLVAPLLSAALSLSLPACDGGSNGLNGLDDMDGPDMRDFVGTWIATSIEFTNKADPSETVDPIQQGGTATLTISANNSQNGTFTFVTNFPGKPTKTTMGSLHFEDGFLIVVDDEVPDDPLRFLFTKSDDRLTLQEEDSEFDFDNDGIVEPATAFYDFDKG